MEDTTFHESKKSRATNHDSKSRGRPKFNPRLIAALHYATHLKWPVLPVHSIKPTGGCTCGKRDCPSPGKHPRINEWQHKATTDDDKIREWFAEHPNSNVGLATGARSGLIVLDVDPEHGGADSLYKLIDQYGPLPDTVQVLTGGGGQHYYFKHPGGEFRNSAGKLGPGLDIRGDGGQVVAPPSIHQSGNRYGYKTSSQPDEVKVAPPPDWLKDLFTKPEPQHAKGTNGKISRGQRNVHLTSLAGSMRRRGMVEEAIADGLLKQNAAVCEPPLRADEVRDIARSIAEYAPTDEGPDTDMANAVRLVSRYGRDLKFTPERGWMAWNGLRWRADEAEVMVRAKETTRSIFDEAAVATDKDKQRSLASWAVKSQRAERLRAMVYLAQSEPGIPARLEDFDADGLLFNVQNGTVDLRTGELQPHSRDDLITRIVDIEYDRNARCPGWERFLSYVMNGDAQMIQFLQRAVGYSLTASTDEQCIFFLYGFGRNGKSVFLEVLKTIMGNYGLAASSQTLMVNKYQAGIPNDIARLAGARFVAVGEVEDGQRLRESLIKDMTGGDTISARFLHREFFDFKPQFKLWIRGNHKPQIRGSDDGIWRRIRLIPFTRQIPAQDRDPHLFHSLQSELPGILAWAVRGCLDYQKNGLCPPKKVTEATADYRQEMDVVGRFVEERCDRGDSELEESADWLYNNYRTWCIEKGHQTLSQTRFGQSLTERGYTKKRHKDGMYYQGLVIRMQARTSEG